MTTVGTLTADEGAVVLIEEFPFVVGTVGTVRPVEVTVSDDEVGVDVVGLVVVTVDDAAESVVTCTDDDCTELAET